MDELKECAWNSYIPASNFFIKNDRDTFEKSATFRILKGTFTNPFLSDTETEETEETNHIYPVEVSNRVKKGVKKPKKRKGPFVLGYQKLPIFPKNSSLTTQQHITCLRVLRFFDKNCISMAPVKIKDDEIILYNELLPTIKIEQKLFNDFVSDIWKTKICGRILKMFPGHKRFIEETWKQKLTNVCRYPPFYQMITMLPLVYTNSTHPLEAVELLRLQNETSSKPTVLYPNLKSPFMLPMTYEKILLKKSSYTARKIYLDDNFSDCERFALENKASVVISVSSLKHIANNYPPYTRTWNLPLTIKEYDITDAKGKPLRHSVVYVDHALPPQVLSSREKSDWCFKLLLKMTLLNSENVESAVNTADTSDKTILYCQACMTFAKNFNKPRESLENINDLDGSSSDDDQEKLIIDSDLEGSPKISGVTTRGMARMSSESPNSIGSNRPPKKMKLNKKQLNFETHFVNECTCDKKLHTLQVNEENAKLISEILKPSGSKQGGTKDSELNENDVTYSLWKIGQSQHESELSKTAIKDIKFIVCSQADGYHPNKENGVKKVILESKLEYQLDYGSETITPYEAATHWTSLQFIPDSKLLRVRTSKHANLVVMMEEFSPQSFNSEIVKQTNWKPQNALGSMFNIFSSLSKMSAGKYLLSHKEKHGAFCVLYHNIPDSCSENGLDLKNAFDINTSEIQINQVAPWVPIDPSLVNPNLLGHDCLPCMFAPDATKFLKESKTVKKIVKSAKKKKRRKPKKTNKSKVVC